MIYLLPLLLLGCEDYFEAVDDREEYRHSYVSEYGRHYEVYGNINVVDAGKRLDKCFLMAADMMEAKYGFPIQHFLATPHEERVIFHIIDATRFQVGGVWARGQQDGRIIRVVWWATSALTKYQDIPTDAPIHTIRESVANPGLWYYGYFDDSVFASLIQHEMGHLLYNDPLFEH